MALTENAKGLQEKLLEAFGETPGDLLETKGGPPKALIRSMSTTSGGLTAGGAVAPLHFDHRNTQISDGARFMNALAAVLVNSPDVGRDMRSFSDVLDTIGRLTEITDAKISAHLDRVFHDDGLQALEASWRGLADLADAVEDDDVIIDFLDASKEELYSDLVDHKSDVFSGELFKKVYIDEYDRYGGKPFAAMIGLYAFDSSDHDVEWLSAMGNVANVAHCPFVASAASTFFQPCKTMEEVAEIGDLDAVLAHPRFGKWNELRDTDQAAYLGLTLPSYLLRQPWTSGGSVRDNDIGYTETVHAGKTDDASNFLWGSAAILFGKNMVRSYEGSGWAQHIRGPRGGGIIEGLTVHMYTKNGYEEIQPPVEIAIPDYRELQFAKNGFIPLVHKKGEATATFFSSQSIKKPRFFVEDLNTKNAHLVTNLAYTFSITRIAHFVKRMMREHIGSSADGPYIQRVLEGWLGQYVTTITNPDDLTLLYYPFKAVEVAVEPKPGPFGWYKATISVLPHVQFEGMDVELRLEAALGGP
jgi:type VI secretion system protein ImpC